MGKVRMQFLLLKIDSPEAADRVVTARIQSQSFVEFLLSQSDLAAREGLSPIGDHLSYPRPSASWADLVRVDREIRIATVHCIEIRECVVFGVER